LNTYFTLGGKIFKKDSFKFQWRIFLLKINLWVQYTFIPSTTHLKKTTTEDEINLLKSKVHFPNNTHFEKDVCEFEVCFIEWVDDKLIHDQVV
jgi:hypothetical protein